MTDIRSRTTQEQPATNNIAASKLQNAEQKIILIILSRLFFILDYQNDPNKEFIELSHTVSNYNTIPNNTYSRNKQKQ
jgi:hypothetical protein